MSLSPLLADGLLITAHALVALTALLLGTAQLVMSKGTTAHRTIGYVWVTLMMFVALGSFWIHGIRLWGNFSPIHILSAITLINLPLAIWAARAGNVRAHKRAMLSFYWLALVLTGAFTLLPGRAMHAVVFGAH